MIAPYFYGVILFRSQEILFTWCCKGKIKSEGTTSELAMSNTSTPVKSGTSKKTSPAKQKLRSPRKVVDKKKVGCLVGSA